MTKHFPDGSSIAWGPEFGGWHIYKLRRNEVSDAERWLEEEKEMAPSDEDGAEC